MKKELQTAIDVLMKNIDELTPEMQSAVKTVLAAVSNSPTSNDLKEEWLDIEGFNGRYQVSNLGRVKRNSILPQRVDCKYSIVSLSKNGKTKHYLVHVLVAKAFVPNPENKPEVNHKFGNRLDNRACMLEWMTSEENKQHAIELGLCKKARGIKSGNAKLTESEVVFIRQNYQPRDEKFGGAALAKKFNVNRSTIFDVITRKSYQDVSGQDVHISKGSTKSTIECTSTSSDPSA